MTNVNKENNPTDYYKSVINRINFPGSIPEHAVILKVIVSIDNSKHLTVNAMFKVSDQVPNASIGFITHISEIIKSDRDSSRYVSRSSKEARLAMISTVSTSSGSRGRKFSSK